MLQRYRSSLRYILHPGNASHLYPCSCFFQRGGTFFSGRGLASTLEHSSLHGILFLEGGASSVSLSLFLSFFSFGCIFTWGGHDYLIHSCILSSLFWGRFFPCGFFPLSPLYKRCAFAFALCTWVPNMA